MKKIVQSIVAVIAMLTITDASAQTAKIQFINNVADHIVDTVDIWLNNTRIVDNLPFRRATTMLTVDSGTHVLTIAKKTSVDTTAQSTLYRNESFRIDTAKIYVAAMAGVVDTTQFVANPNSVARGVEALVYEIPSETTVSNEIALSFMHGTPDASTFDMNVRTQKLADNVVYKQVSPSLDIATATNGILLFRLTSGDSTSFKGVYRLRTSTLAGKRGVLFTSGFESATGNPSNVKLMKVFVAMADGTVRELDLLKAEIQVVHASADVTADSVDIYLNGSKLLDNFAFRTATPFTALNALDPYSIVVAPKNSASVADGIYTLNVVLDSNFNYYAIAHGVITPANYKPNPNGKSTAFKITTYKGARKTATISKNVDLLYFHASTDMFATTIKGDAQVQFLSKDDAYGDFHGYGIHSSIDNIATPVKNAITDVTMYNGFMNLSLYQGKAGLAVLTGFDSANATINQNGDTTLLIVVWPDGNVDSIAPPRPTTGLKQFQGEALVASLYPNPSSADEVYLNLNKVLDATATITITDITGRIHATISQVGGANKVVIPTVGMQSGTYFVTLQSNEQSATMKLHVIR